MAIVRVENKTYTVDTLYQWDLNQVLQIHGLSMAVAPEIHFTNSTMVRAVRRFATMDAAGIISAEIPNALLQSAQKIRAIVCVREGDVFKSYYEILIPVKARPQPADYTITTDEDIYSFLELENLVYDSVADMTAKYNQVEATVKAAVNTANTAAKNANDASAAVQNAVNGKVNTTGDTMTGDLNMSGNAVKGLKAPTDDGDAVPKSYAENADNLKNGTIPAARLGTIGAANGGTGKNSVTAGNFLVGNGTGTMQEKTPEQARVHMGAVKMATVQAVLSAAGWTDSEQTVAVSGVTADNVVIIASAPDSYTDYADGRVRCSAQAAGALTFACDFVPDNDITVNVLILA